MSRLCCIVFSYNRAMQLELLLRSMREKLVNDVAVYVVWHCAPEHDTSYRILIEEWERKGVIFWRRSEKPHSLLRVLPYLFRVDNLVRYIRYDYFRRGIDDFKDLVETAIAHSEASHVFFSTDDQYFAAETWIPQKVLEIIHERPDAASYKFNVGRNLREFPMGMPFEEFTVTEQERSISVLEWDYYDPQATSHWAYPFSVDETVFDACSLVHFLHGMLYHMPTTLEAFGVSNVKRQRRFRKGMSPGTSTVVGMPLNRVQQTVANKSGNFSPGVLSRFFVEGFRLAPGSFGISSFVHVPSELVLRNGSKEQRVRESDFQ